MNVGQDVRHLRRPDCGVGRIVEIYPDGSCKAIFPGHVFTGVSASLFEAVCLETIREEEKEAARQKEAELEAAWDRKRKQAEEDRQRRRDAMRDTWPRYASSRTAVSFNDELQRLSVLSDAYLRRAMPATQLLNDEGPPLEYCLVVFADASKTAQGVTHEKINRTVFKPRQRNFIRI